MKKQLPPLSVSMIALTACGNRVGLNDKMQDQELVAFCESQIACQSKILQDVYLFYCVDSVQDERHRAKAIGCESEFTELFTCELKEADSTQCRSDYDDLDDWSDDAEEEYYSDNDDPCEDEMEEYTECVEDFMGIDNNSDTGYND
jgi:hypothetical protein